MSFDERPYGATVQADDEIVVSIVVHDWHARLPSLVQSLTNYENVKRIVLTLNKAQPADYLSLLPSDKKICFISNPTELGFGANHNQAFKEFGHEGKYYCVMNPDIEVRSNPFQAVLGLFSTHPAIAVISPRIVDGEDRLEDHVRAYPTFFELLGKLLGVGVSNTIAHDSSSSLVGKDFWLAGMFLVFRSKAFATVSGFDTKFYLYYEDVDISARLCDKGFLLGCEHSVSVIHHAQRASRRSMRHLRWHLASVSRYFLKKFLKSFRNGTR